MFAGLSKYKATRPDQFWSTTVPAHWQVMPGMAVLTENKARNTGLAESQVLSLSYGRVIVKPVEKQRGLVPDSYDGYQILEPGDIVIRPTDLQNDQTSVRVGRVRDRGIITSAYIGVRSRSPWTTDYAYSYLVAVDSTKRIYGMGRGLRQQLGWPDLKRMPCLVPPAAEQAAIVKYLAHANSRIDKAIAAKRRLIALIQEERAALVFERVTGGTGLRGAPDQRHLPEGWTVEPFLRTVVERADYRGATPEKVDDGVILVTAKNVRSGWIDYETSQEFVREVDYPRIMRRGLPRIGDILLTMEAPLGNVALVDREDVAFAQRVVRFRTDPNKLRPGFAVLAMNSAYFQDQLGERATGSTAAGIKASKLPQLELALPPVEEQDRIVRDLAAETTMLDDVRDREARAVSLLQEFRTRLIADAVTGQVDVRTMAASLPAPDAASRADVNFVDDADELEMDDLMEMSEV